MTNACFVRNVRVTGRHSDSADLCPLVVSLSGRVAKTNIESNTAFRGFGGPQGQAVAEVELPAHVSFGSLLVFRRCTGMLPANWESHGKS